MTVEEEKITNNTIAINNLQRLLAGNGTTDGSVIGRLKDLEETSHEIRQIVDKLANEVCGERCAFLSWKKKEDKMRLNKRNWRIGDIANVLQMLALIAVLYGMFIL